MPRKSPRSTAAPRPACGGRGGATTTGGRRRTYRMRHALIVLNLFTLALAGGCASDHASKSEGKATADGWRHLPLITEGKIDPAWKHTGFGGFVVDNGVLRTEAVPEGLGLLVYSKE